MRLGWYLNRLRRMSVAELSGRLRVAARQRRWRSLDSRPDGLETVLPGPRSAGVALRRDQAPERAAAVIAAAEELLEGYWPIFHLRPASVGPAPNWFHDPLTGRQSARNDYAFAIPYRDETEVGNVKFVWEMSRHQATTVLASAWWSTGDERYALRVQEHLTSWWALNPFLEGVHWTSAIEVGLRLLSWAWIRALLAEWPGVRALFDDNETFVRQLYHHMLYIRTFHSRGSSANNHLVAELAGLSAACDAFPWFAESAVWGGWARVLLAQTADAQTHDDGFNREQASEYHLFVFEMLAAAALTTRLSGRSPASGVEQVMRRMADALAASLDANGAPPRFGDGDDGRGVLLDAPGTERVDVALDVARALFGEAAWWPRLAPTVLGHVARMTAPDRAAPRAVARPDVFASTGMTLLRDGRGADEIYVRCDAGPHGYLSIAAHGHADALSVELRHGGVEILADPGTYCYHGEPAWRALFKGTLGHNTLCIADQDQARSAGPFLWLDHPRSRTIAVDCDGPIKTWHAQHEGYRRAAQTTHHRSVTLDRARASVTLEDWIEAPGARAAALAFHFGPDVEASLDGAVASLRWPNGSAVMLLPPGLEWRAHRGENSPPLGWYSNGFGHKTPSTTLIGRGRLTPGVKLATTVEFESSVGASRICETLHAAF